MSAQIMSLLNAMSGVSVGPLYQCIYSNKHYTKYNATFLHPNLENLLMNAVVIIWVSTVDIKLSSVMLREW